MMIERLNGRAAVGIAAVGLLLVVLVGWFGVVAPQRSKADELSGKIDDAEAELAVTETLIHGPSLRLNKAELATLRTAIPDEVKMSQILRQLSKISRNSHIRILGVTPQPVVTVGVSDVVAMSVAVEGRYFGIREFLRRLRTRADLRSDKVRAFGRLFAVDSLQFTGASAEAGGGLIQATLIVTAFAFSDTAPPPPGTESTFGAPVGVAAGGTGSEAASR